MLASALASLLQDVPEHAANTSATLVVRILHREATENRKTGQQKLESEFCERKSRSRLFAPPAKKCVGSRPSSSSSSSSSSWPLEGKEGPEEAEARSRKPVMRGPPVERMGFEGVADRLLELRVTTHVSQCTAVSCYVRGLTRCSSGPIQPGEGRLAHRSTCTPRLAGSSAPSAERLEVLEQEPVGSNLIRAGWQLFERRRHLLEGCRRRRRRRPATTVAGSARVH